jgi:hypothetical protein
MKQKASSLSVTEFQQLLERLCASTTTELQQTRARMEVLRDHPPG